MLTLFILLSFAMIKKQIFLEKKFVYKHYNTMQTKSNGTVWVLVIYYLN